MTNQEAIKYLEEINIASSKSKMNKMYEAIGMAIKALEQIEPEKCGDCISREAAIYAVGYYSVHSDDKLLFADKPLKDLPSVEPERKTGHWHLLDECANEGWYCDQCNKKVFRADFSNTMKKYKFCPNCGAKMEV